MTAGESWEGGKASTGWAEEAKVATLQDWLGPSANATPNPIPGPGTTVRPKRAAFRGGGRDPPGFMGLGGKGPSVSWHPRVPPNQS